jgi:hypothetical protein
MNCGPTVAVADLDVSMQGALMSEKFGWVAFVLLSEGPLFLFAGGGASASMSARHVSCVGRRWLALCGLRSYVDSVAWQRHALFVDSID